MANRYIIDGELVSADVYNKVKYDSMLVRFPKGQKDVIQSHAAARGESVNGFIGRAITETMERDGADAAQDAVKSADGGGGNSIPDKTETPPDGIEDAMKGEKSHE